MVLATCYLKNINIQFVEDLLQMEIVIIEAHEKMLEVIQKSIFFIFETDIIYSNNALDSAELFNKQIQITLNIKNIKRNLPVD